MTPTGEGEGGEEEGQKRRREEREREEKEEKEEEEEIERPPSVGTTKTTTTTRRRRRRRRERRSKCRATLGPYFGILWRVGGLLGHPGLGGPILGCRRAVEEAPWDISLLSWLS